MAESPTHNEEKMQNAANGYSESAVLHNLIRQILKRWYLFVLVAFIAGIVGYIYAAGKKPVYESYISFALDDGADGGGKSVAMGLASQFGISLGSSGSVFGGDNILKIMTSRRMLEDALLSVDSIDNKPVTLIEYYRRRILSKDQLELPRITYLPGENRSDFSYSKDSLLYQIQLAFNKNVVTAQKPDNNVNIYELIVRTPEERFSKLFSESLIKNTNNFYTEIRSKKSKETFEILEKRVPVVKSKLDATIQSQADMQDANLNTAFAKAQVGQLQQLSDSKVYGAAYGEMFKNLEVARFQYLQSIPLMQIIDGPEYPMKKIRAGKVKTGVVFALASLLILFLGFVAMIIIKYLKAKF